MTTTHDPPTHDPPPDEATQRSAADGRKTGPEATAQP